MALLGGIAALEVNQCRPETCDINSGVAAAPSDAAVRMYRLRGAQPDPAAATDGSTTGEGAA
jgi:hypothetical protein